MSEVKHTPGPWVVGTTFGQHLRIGKTTCGHCGKLPLVKVYEAERPCSGDFTRTVHVHLHAETSNPEYFRSVVSAATGDCIVGMFDYEDGGVCTNLDDALLIAAAPDLLAVCEAVMAYYKRIPESYWLQFARDARAAIAKVKGGAA